jgi:hypothetical protein
MRDWLVLNVRGVAIGMVTAANESAAVRAWNRANVASSEVAVSASPGDTTTEMYPLDIAHGIDGDRFPRRDD